MTLSHLLVVANGQGNSEGSCKWQAHGAAMECEKAMKKVDKKLEKHHMGELTKLLQPHDQAQ
jgi:hypothetical protein